MADYLLQEEGGSTFKVFLKDIVMTLNYKKYQI